MDQPGNPWRVLRAMHGQRPNTSATALTTSAGHTRTGKQRVATLATHYHDSWQAPQVRAQDKASKTRIKHLRQALAASDLLKQATESLKPQLRVWSQRNPLDAP
eukprot:5286555-Amphidinium_carterae.1